MSTPPIHHLDDEREGNRTIQNNNKNGVSFLCGMSCDVCGFVVGGGHLFSTNVQHNNSTNNNNNNTISHHIATTNNQQPTTQRRQQQPGVILGTVCSDARGHGSERMDGFFFSPSLGKRDWIDPVPGRRNKTFPMINTPGWCLSLR